jgi:ligand-binding sensor domain-containing protein
VARPAKIADIHGTIGEFIGTYDPAASASHSPDRVLWIVRLHDLLRVENGRLTRILYPDISFSDGLKRERTLVSEDDTSTVWAAIGSQGLINFSRGIWNSFPLPSSLSGKSQSSMSVDSRGRIWVAFRGGMSIIINKGKLEQIFRLERFGVGDIRTVKDHNGHFWIGGERGLAYFDESRVVPIFPFDMSDFARVYGVEEDSEGGLWLCRDQDVIHIKVGEWKSVVNGLSRRVRYVRDLP